MFTYKCKESVSHGIFEGVGSGGRRGGGGIVGGAGDLVGGHVDDSEGGMQLV